MIYSLSRFRRQPQNEYELKNEDDLKNEDNLKNKDDRKNEDDHKNEDSLKNEEIKFDVMKEMYAALGMHTCSEKTTF